MFHNSSHMFSKIKLHTVKGYIASHHSTYFVVDFFFIGATILEPLGHVCADIEIKICFWDTNYSLVNSKCIDIKLGRNCIFYAEIKNATHHFYLVLTNLQFRHYVYLRISCNNNFVFICTIQFDIPSIQFEDLTFHFLWHEI